MPANKKSKKKFLLNDNSLDALIDSFPSESDRGTAIILHSYIENQLNSLLTRRLLPGYDLPGAFIHKVRLAFAIGALTTEEKTALISLNNIRNEFAHGITNVTFNSLSTDSINDCNSLELTNYFIKPSDFSTKSDLRKKYELVAINLIVILHFRSIDQISEYNFNPQNFEAPP